MPIRNLLLTALVLSALTAASALAREKSRSAADDFRGGGLNVSLSASRVKVLQPGPPVTPASSARRPARSGFGSDRPGTEAIIASAVAANASRANLVFNFPDPASAERKWTFRVFDSDENLVWTSDGDVAAPQVITEATLEPGRRWRRTVRVPLIIDGVPLAAGIYHLEAGIDADKKPGAATIFEVVARDTPPAGDSGIRGQVLKEILPPGDDRAFEPAAGAHVTVQQIGGEDRPADRRPLFWSVRANEEGGFSVPAPAGRHRVTASLAPRLDGNDGEPVFPPKSAEVTVTAGQFSEVTIRLEAQRPPVERGAIRGLVLIGPINPVEREGEPNERPLPGAQVVVEQLGAPDGQPPFRWTGRTGERGRFELAAPAGRYLVVASGPEPGRLPVPAREEITVDAGRTTEVTLHLDSGIR